MYTSGLIALGLCDASASPNRSNDSHMVLKDRFAGTFLKPIFVVPWYVERHKDWVLVMLVTQTILNRTRMVLPAVQTGEVGCQAMKDFQISLC